MRESSNVDVQGSGEIEGKPETWVEKRRLENERSKRERDEE